MHDVHTQNPLSTGNTIALHGAIALKSTGFSPVERHAVAPAITLDLRGGWNGGTLKISITAHGTDGDHLTLPPTPVLWLNTKNLVLMSGSIPIGTASHPSVRHANQWTFTFNNNATTELVQSVAQAVAFTRSYSEPPDEDGRTVTFVATNAAGTFAATQTVSATTMDGSPTEPTTRQVAVLGGINDYIDVQGYRF